MSPNGPETPIRITPAFFFLLLTLVDGERHGYAMAKEVAERSDGSIDLGPGSLYWSLGRLQKSPASVVQFCPSHLNSRHRFSPAGGGPSPGRIV